MNRSQDHFRILRSSGTSAPVSRAGYPTVRGRSRCGNHGKPTSGWTVPQESVNQWTSCNGIRTRYQRNSFRSRVCWSSSTKKIRSCGKSSQTALGHAKDSTWSLDLFRRESAVLRTHWVLVAMDHCTRRIVGFGVLRGVVDGVIWSLDFQRYYNGHRTHAGLEGGPPSRALMSAAHAQR
jgi:hypothetical protein